MELQLKMKTLDSIIFDLDGTLWDTNPVCAISWNNVVRRNNIDFREITSQDIREVAGKPHDECIRKVFNGLPEIHLQLLINETMTEDNLTIDQHGGRLYPLVKEGLVQLQKNTVFIL